MFKTIATVFVVVLAIHSTKGYEKGAPKDACADMIPQHHTPPQTSPFPYTITLDKHEIKGGEKVQVFITGTESHKNFKGFFVQARVEDTVVGKFDPADGVKLVDCGDSVGSGATHATSDVKEKVVLKWNAPQGLSEIVKFRVTVAQDGGTFWVGHFSKPLVVKS